MCLARGLKYIDEIDVNEPMLLPDEQAEKKKLAKKYQDARGSVKVTGTSALKESQAYPTRLLVQDQVLFS